MKRNVHVVGVGMIPFTKPGASDPYTVMGARAATAALADAGVDYRLVQQAYVGYVYGDSTAGQAAVYGVGLTGILERGRCRTRAHHGVRIARTGLGERDHPDPDDMDISLHDGSC